VIGSIPWLAGRKGSASDKTKRGDVGKMKDPALPEELRYAPQTTRDREVRRNKRREGGGEGTLEDLEGWGGGRAGSFSAFIGGEQTYGAVWEKRLRGRVVILKQKGKRSQRKAESFPVRGHSGLRVRKNAE